MILRRFAIASTILVALATTYPHAIQAADDPIATRQQLMKNVGSATRALGEMVRGKAEYNAATAEQAMRSIAASSAAFKHYFPEGSETGGDTEALLAIWEKNDEFVAINDKMMNAAFAGVAGAKTDLDSLKAAFGPVVQNCKSCHEGFRQAN